MNGDIIIDFAHERKKGPAGFSFNGSNVDRLWVVQYNDDSTEPYFNIILNEISSTVVLYVPDLQDLSVDGKTRK